MAERVPEIPTIDRVRGKFATVLDESQGWRHSEEWGRDFDRWLAAHDVRVRAQTLREAADERGVNVSDEDGEWWSGYRQAQREVIFWLCDRADAIEGGSGE